MIPTQNIIAWSKHVPWAEQRQVEQDLIIARALVELFNDSFLRKELRFRGGTALNKLHFLKPLRYSEDIDFVRTTAGGIGPILDRIRDILTPWLGNPRFDQSEVAPKFRFKTNAEDGLGLIRLKVEINTREREAYDPAVTFPFKVENPWFSGATEIPTFSNEELLSTKLRALLQRNKGRDLVDLSHSLDIFEKLNTKRIVELFGKYLELSGQAISRAQAEQRMFDKLERPDFLADVKPLLTADEAAHFTDETGRKAFAVVFRDIIRLIPGEPWANTAERIEQHDLADLLAA
ncbi:nucleotidyl transferase AbiEii/AbiGii toxin family protein [Bradyrhizobium uaiense]|uniref:Nucleotidyl transferase AbiEii/AbiGii toxin family protein n=1 Tax=Bradyrhizobium uaiense TaxID=2594946 RepID=A0A6P1BH86_9BRAD|nr:nucleotidyl transferase AbiEii/AbiGii toxin family protein [Bradyrhizobium uaiense]